MNSKFAGIGHDLRADRAPVTIDGATGQVIDAPHVIIQHAGDAPQGFGPTRKFLDVEPIRQAPWLTPALVELELTRAGTKGS